MLWVRDVERRVVYRLPHCFFLFALVFGALRGGVGPLGIGGEEVAYSLGFFLGPGRPRDLASVCPVVRLLPGFGPGMAFRRGVSAGVAPVAGVELASSEPLSAEEGRTVGSSPEEAGEERSLVSGVS